MKILKKKISKIQSKEIRESLSELLKSINK